MTGARVILIVAQLQWVLSLSKHQYIHVFTTCHGELAEPHHRFRLIILNKYSFYLHAPRQDYYQRQR